MFGKSKKNQSDISDNRKSEEKKFISELSYNVRNPLNTICGVTEITRKSILNGSDNDTLLSYIDILSDAATELQQTIDHFFERFESGDFVAQQEVKQESVGADVLKNLRVMVVEDSSVSQLIAREMLESRGSIVTICDSGKEAVEMFKGSITGTYDVILMDINMPGMDGYEATDAIRSSGHVQAQTVPIIAMTAEALPDDIQTALKAGMNGHISKPINADKIVSAIKRVM